MGINLIIDENGNLSNIFGIIMNKHQNEEWVQEIYNTVGKSSTQKVYNYVYKYKTIPKCPSCGEYLRFIDYESGYAKCDCNKIISNNLLKEPNKSILSNDNINKLKNGQSVKISSEKNFDTNECSSTIITSYDGDDETKILNEHGFDPSKWMITKMTHSQWDSNIGENIETLYSSKVFVKPRDVHHLNDSMIFDTMNKAINYKSENKSCIELNSCKSSSSMLVIPLADFHFGLYATKKSCNDEYNMDIASFRLNTFIDKVLNEVKNKNINEITFTLGNDYFNADNLIGTTTHGTPQDQEGKYFSIFDRGMNLAIDQIEKLKKVAHVNVLSVQGNHDKATSHFLMCALYQRYKDSKSVNVVLDSDESARRYYVYGENLLGFGHDTKIKECHKLMATEASEYWSSTKYKTFFLGHLHHEEVQEIGDVVIRRLPILSGKSEWTNDKGYVNSGPRAQAFIFNKDKGLENIINVEMN